MKKTEQVTSQAQKKKHLSPSTRKRNAQRINQWKAKRNEAVGDSKTCAQTQTDDSNSTTDETTQTEQLHSDEQALHKPTTLTQIRERSTQTRSNFIGRQLTPTKYLDTEESRTPWNKCTAVRSPYIRGKLTYKTEFKDGSVSSESFDPDDPALIDRYPEYTTETDLGDKPPTPTQQRDENSKRNACKKKTNLSAIPDKVSRT